METVTPNEPTDDTDDGQFVGCSKPSAATKVCGSKLRKKPGQFCKRLCASGRTRCVLHGGRTPRGSDSPHFKTGLFSRVIPKNLRATFAALAADPTLLEGRAEVSLMQVRLAQLTGRIGTNESGANWRELQSVFNQFRAANEAGDEPAMLAGLNRMNEIINGKVNDNTAWSELTECIEKATRVSEREWKRVFASRYVVSAESVKLIVATLVQAVNRYADAPARVAIAEHVRRLNVLSPDELASTTGSSH